MKRNGDIKPDTENPIKIQKSGDGEQYESSEEEEESDDEGDEELEEHWQEYERKKPQHKEVLPVFYPNGKNLAFLYHKAIFTYQGREAIFLEKGDSTIDALYSHNFKCCIVVIVNSENYISLEHVDNQKGVEDAILDTVDSLKDVGEKNIDIAFAIDPNGYLDDIKGAMRDLAGEKGIEINEQNHQKLFDEACQMCFGKQTLEKKQKERMDDINKAIDNLEKEFKKEEFKEGNISVFREIINLPNGAIAVQKDGRINNFPNFNPQPYVLRWVAEARKRAENAKIPSPLSPKQI